MISQEAPDSSSATEALLRLFLTKAPVSLAIFDREMRYLLFTNHWAEQLGLTGQSLSGRPHAEFMPEQLQGWQEAQQKVLAGETVAFEGDSFQHPDGNRRWIDWEASPWTATGGEVAGSVVTFQEITQQRNVESQLRREMETASATNQAKARLLMTTGYEVRSTMNSIIGMANLCLRSSQTDKDQEHLNTIVKQAKVLNSSFNDILDLSKIETGHLKLNKEEFNLADILNEISHTIGLQAEEKGVEFVYQLPPSPPPPLLGDAGRLKQVLHKLCENGVHLTERGEVELSMETVTQEEESITLEFAVRDTSPAFSPEERETLLAPVSPTEDTSTMLAKTRVGLAICKSIVGLMNGELRIASTRGEGNVFTFSASFALPAKAEIEDDAPPNALSGARVLVVDDHRLARKTMARLLKTFDFDVSVAESGPEAIEMTANACTRGRPFQFVFMDYLMPGMNGIETTTRLKERVRNLNPPKVILMTGRPMEDKKKELEDSPLDGYISKPFTPSLIFFAMMDAATAWPANGEDSPSASIKADYGSALRGKRVLLVEDDPINQEIVQEILGDIGVTVDIANQGEEGLECLERETYQAVLMDIQMPVMDGYEATCRIRNQERFADLPIIALTASAMTLDRHASLEVGMNAHIAKPINPEELFSVLSEWMQQGPIEQDKTPKPLPVSTDESDPSTAGDAPPSSLGEASPVFDPFPTVEFDAVEPTPPMERSEPTEPALKFESLDISKGIAFMGGKEDLYRRVLQKFATNQAGTDREIKAAMSMNDHQTALRLVHTLKGLAGNIGAQTLADRVIELEIVLKRAEENDYHAYLSRMSSELQKVVREISTICLGSNPDPALARN